MSRPVASKEAQAAGRGWAPGGAFALVIGCTSGRRPGLTLRSVQEAALGGSVDTRVRALVSRSVVTQPNQYRPLAKLESRLLNGIGAGNPCGMSSAERSPSRLGAPR